MVPPALERPLLACASLAAAFLLGAAFMQALLAARLGRVRGFSLAPDTRPAVCTVVLEGIRDGRVVGTLAGSGRVFVGAVQGLPGRDGGFAVDAKEFLTHRVTVTVPPGSAFVASRRGSRYYPLAGAAGQGIAPQNRVYFATRAQAEAAGYRP